MAAYFPLFINLENRHCVIVGGGRAATIKVRALLPFANRITVIAPWCTETLSAWQKEGKITYLNRAYIQGDLQDAFMAVAATDQEAVNQQVLHEAEKSNIFISVAHKGDQGNFIFPSVVQRGPLIVGITASGKSPGLSAFTKKLVDRTLPQEMDEWAWALEKARKELKQKGIPPEEKKKILSGLLQQMSEEAFIKNRF